MYKKSTKSSRLQLAKYLSRHLCTFGSGFDNKFICPTCLKSLDLELDQNTFTAGHILPQASGGKEWTLLCKACNSHFGEKQDKWFGEYLNILNNPKGTFLHAKTKSKYITLNQITVCGSINESEDGLIDIFIPINTNSPYKITALNNVLDLEDNLEVGFQPEVLKHDNEIEVGYITAAYLMWFHNIGYNWVLQSSLDIVRQQILECNCHLDGARVIDLDLENSHYTEIGLITQLDEIYPCCIIFDKLIVFPSPLYKVLPKNLIFKKPFEIKFMNFAILNLPYLIFYDNCPVIIPDRLNKFPPTPDYALYLKSEAPNKYIWLKRES
ncbi:MAG: HNH endonuclease [Thiofilum sp.]|uniref:HNH endonuclease n=1 Tax=Thiofilum sp. TaxID=2212733 RepID=UPI0025D5B7B8|nr:HNH endonuclease [Thiofilum sp.]